MVSLLKTLSCRQQKGPALIIPRQLSTPELARCLLGIYCSQ